MQLVGLVADLHAAHLVDALDGQVIAVGGVHAVGRVLAGLRHRGAEGDRILGQGRAGAQRHQAGNGQCAQKLGRTITDNRRFHLGVPSFLVTCCLVHYKGTVPWYKRR